MATKIGPERAAILAIGGDGPAMPKAMSSPLNGLGKETMHANDVSGRAGKVYAVWPCGIGAEIRLMVTVRYGSPVAEVRYGELANGRWHPSHRGVSFKPSQVGELITALRAAEADLKRLGLKDDDYLRSSASARRNR